MACDGSSGCGCTCLCWCRAPQVYYGFGIYAAPRPIPNALAFQAIEPVSGGATALAFLPAPAVVSQAYLAPPGAGSGPPTIEWGPKGPIQPGPRFRWGGRSQGAGWGGDDFLSPPPLEALKDREPGPVLFPPTTKVLGPREEVGSPEAGSLAPTYDVGDSSGAIQSMGGVPVTATAVRPPDSFLGIQEPTPYARAAMAPPLSGEFLQGAHLGPGAGIGSEGSDPFEDNGRFAPMDPTAAEDAFPGAAEPEETFPVEPGDAPVTTAREPLRAPDFPGHPIEGPVAPASLLRMQEARSPLPGSPAEGGGSFRPHVGSRPSVRPGIGFSHGKGNPTFAAAVDARMQQLDAERRRQEAAQDGLKAAHAKDAKGMQLADARGMLAKVDRDLAGARADAAVSEAEAANKGVSSLAKRVAEEAERQHEREERKLVKMSAGTGDVAAARTAMANLRVAAENRDRATRLHNEASSARQDDRVRTAEGRAQSARDEVHKAKRDLEAARLKDPQRDLKVEKDRLADATKTLKLKEATAARTRQEARDPKARQEFKHRKAEAKKAAKEARKAASEARKAARREKNAARYGPKAALKRAQEEAAKKRAVSDAKSKDAEEANRRLTDPEDPLVPPSGSAAGPQPPAAGAGCACAPPCPSYSECVCQCLAGDGTGPGGTGEGGTKGKHAVQVQAVAPPDSGVGPKNLQEALKLDDEERERKEKSKAEGKGDGDDVSAAQPKKLKKVPPPKPRKKLLGKPWKPPAPVYPQDSLDPLPAIPSPDVLGPGGADGEIQRETERQIAELNRLAEEDRRRNRLLSTDIPLARMPGGGPTIRDLGVVVIPYGRSVGGKTKVAEDFIMDVIRLLTHESPGLAGEIQKLLITGGQNWDGTGHTLRMKGAGKSVYYPRKVLGADGRWRVHLEMISFVTQGGDKLPLITFVHEEGHRGAFARVFSIMSRAHPRGFGTVEEVTEYVDRLRSQINRVASTEFHEIVHEGTSDMEEPFLIAGPQVLWQRARFYDKMFGTLGAGEGGVLLVRYLKELGRSGYDYATDRWHVDRKTVNMQFPWVNYLEYDKEEVPSLVGEKRE